MTPKRTLVRRLDDMGVTLLLMRLLLGGVFVALAWNKLTAEPKVFLKAVRLYNVLPLDPPWMVNSVAIVLPYLELVCGAALVLGVFVRGAALATAAMLAVFTPALYMHSIKLMNEAPWRYDGYCSIKFDCGCGTGEEWMCEKIPTNLGLFALAALALRSNSRRFSLHSLIARRMSPAPPPVEVSEPSGAG